ncbi:uncharacterized protein LOC141538308 [Cotesia typhae]|uniref:uncharacterized protein LOC141538308 n=1 Tax=Cotesia typhae TaxID=2053667 RepID=UPI003D691600
MVRCNVKRCLRRPEKDKDHSFFFLWPKEERIRQQWKDFAQYKGSSNSLRICSDHFERRYIKKNAPPKRLLVPNAVPTLLPPDNILKMPKNMPKPPLTNSTAKNLLVNVNNEEVIFERPALKDECSHNDRGITFEIRKATDNEPALINIETNSFVKISLRDEREIGKSTEPLNPEAVIRPTDSQEPKFNAAEKLINTVEAASQNDTYMPILPTNSEEPKSNAALEELPFNNRAETLNLNISPEIPAQYSTPKKNHKFIRKFELFSKKTPSQIMKSPNAVSSKVKKIEMLTPKSLRLHKGARTIGRLRSQINRMEKKFAVKK